MKKLLSLFLVIAVMLPMCIVGASAVPSPYYYGDANTDWDVDILDVTTIQKTLAKLVTMSVLQCEAGDVDNDGDISILDATMIQRKLAKIITVFPAGEELRYYISNFEVTHTYDGQSIVSGKPVTFVADAYTQWEPLTFEYYIDNIFVGLVANGETFTYTFDEEGYYNLSIVAKNSLDWTSEYVEELYVVNLDSSTTTPDQA